MVAPYDVRDESDPGNVLASLMYPDAPTPGDLYLAGRIVRAGGIEPYALVAERVNARSISAAYALPPPTSYSLHRLTLGASLTLTMPPAVAGQSFTVTAIQDAVTGSRIITWASVKWAGGSAPTLSTAASSVDSLAFWCESAAAGWYGAVVGLGFA